MISIFVTIQVKDGYAEQFTEASFGDGQGSVRDETGCYRFDILRNAEDRINSIYTKFMKTNLRWMHTEMLLTTKSGGRR